MRDLSQRFGNSLLNILLGKFRCFVLFVKVWVTLHVEIAEVLKLFDLGLELVLFLQFGLQVVVGGEFSLLDFLFLVDKFIPFLLQVSKFLSLVLEEEIVKISELDFLLRSLFLAGLCLLRWNCSSRCV